MKISSPVLFLLISASCMFSKLPEKKNEALSSFIYLSIFLYLFDRDEVIHNTSIRYVIQTEQHIFHHPVSVTAINSSPILLCNIFLNDQHWFFQHRRVVFKFIRINYKTQSGTMLSQLIHISPRASCADIAVDFSTGVAASFRFQRATYRVFLSRHLFCFSLIKTSTFDAWHQQHCFSTFVRINPYQIVSEMPRD